MKLDMFFFETGFKVEIEIGRVDLHLLNNY